MNTPTEPVTRAQISYLLEALAREGVSNDGGDFMRGKMAAAILALFPSVSHAGEEGWKLVPRTPTEAMYAAARNVPIFAESNAREDWRRDWQAMYDAAPSTKPEKP